MAIHLTRIYTRTGDHGRTRNARNQEISKTSPQLAAYAAVEELNCALGLVPTRTPLLTRLQQELFDLGSVIAGTPQSLDPATITHLEQRIDALSSTLPPLSSFILPGGTPDAAHLHQARVTARAAERALWAYVETLRAEEEAVDKETKESKEKEQFKDLLLAGQYLNRISDLLFVLAREANDNGKAEILWIPADKRKDAEQSSED
ncbi:MAG: cob(I)yrinic acid a,c-diamide adenosyltransferase [Corynebacterium sp.]|nr:cob(I)yrinic acid a,c-diamide adenosyltransferase [Corynebacterium sp.]